jgi:hypothetical protein
VFVVVESEFEVIIVVVPIDPPIFEASVFAAENRELLVFRLLTKRLVLVELIALKLTVLVLVAVILVANRFATVEVMA